MKIICLDLEGVLIPEIWIAFSEATGIADFRRTTRDEPDYDKLMNFRIDLLARHKLKLKDIQQVIAGVEPLSGAKDFVLALKKKAPFVILSDTFTEFAAPVMAKLDYPSLFCNSLKIADCGSVSGYRIRQENGKKNAVAAFKSMNLKVFAAGDSYNDLAMIAEADDGCLFLAPKAIKESHAHIPQAETYRELSERIDMFLSG